MVRSPPAKTLYSIANRVRPANANVNQMMIALLRANPNAFINGNINLVKRGAILSIPDAATVANLSSSAALAEVQNQTDAWRGYQPTVAATPRTTSTGPSSTSRTAADDSSEARLRLVAPGGDEDQPGVGGTGGRDAAGDPLLQEELDARRQESADLSEKLVEANEIIDLLQRQIELKNNELASLQQQLSDQGDGEAMVEAADDLLADAADDVAEGVDELLDDVADDVTDVVDDVAGDDELDDLLALPDADADGEDEILGDIEDDGAAVASDLDDVDTALDSDIAEPEYLDDDVASDDEIAATDEDIAADVDIDVSEPEADTSATTPVVAATDTSSPAAGPLGGLIPAGILDAIPGGLKTLLAALAAIVLGVIALIAKRFRGGDEDIVATAAAPSAAAPDSTIEQAMTDTLTDFDAEATLDSMEAEAEDHESTTMLESTMDVSDPDATLVDDEDVDPLEEVNVYLAYERFDQAEELVREAIAENPNDHQFKLRLLEVFYSSNDKTSYEEAARDLYDAVGENDPLWDSALAMWNEMSPSREIFDEDAAGLGDTLAATRGTAKAFVDLSGETQDGTGGDTMSIGPGEPEALERTAVGTMDDDDEPVFDVTAGDEEEDLSGADEILDLTSTTGNADDDVFDLTATTDAPTEADDDIIDLTHTGDLDELVSDAGDEDVFDISGESAPEGDNADLDFTDTEVDPTIADIASEGDNADPLAAVTDSDVTVSESTSEDPSIVEPGTDKVIEFDLSDTVQPPIASTQAISEDVFDAIDDDVSPDEVGETEDLDFKVADLTAEIDDPQSDMDVTETMGMDLGQNVDLGADLDEPAEVGAGDDLDFDFSLTETTEMQAAEIEETLELPKEQTVQLTEEAEGEDTLADLARSMELSMEELDAQLDATGNDLELTLEFEDDEIDPDLTTDESTAGAEALKVDDGDDFDTKLNLAKAYVELGDHEGARTILDEVNKGGSAEQQAQAQELLGQIG